MNATMLKMDLSDRTATRADCAPARREITHPSRMVAPAIAGRSCRALNGVPVADSTILRTVDFHEAQNRKVTANRSSSAELRQAAREAIQARGERIVFAILASGSIALLAAAGTQGLHLVGRWASLVDFVASILA